MFKQLGDSYSSAPNDADPNSDGLTPEADGSTLSTSQVFKVPGFLGTSGFAFHFDAGDDEVSGTVTFFMWDPTSQLWVALRSLPGVTRRVVVFDTTFLLVGAYVFAQLVTAGGTVDADNVVKKYGVAR